MCITKQLTSPEGEGIMKEEAVTVERGPAKRARLWNDGDKTFDYEILGERYVIEPGKSIDVARRTAINIRGFYPGKNKPVSLRIEPIEGAYEEAKPEALKDIAKERVMVYSCYKCDEEFDSKEKLVAHMKEKHTPGKKVQPTQG
jgi:hypothetical protein